MPTRPADSGASACRHDSTRHADTVHHQARRQYLPRVGPIPRCDQINKAVSALPRLALLDRASGPFDVELRPFSSCRVACPCHRAFWYNFATSPVSVVHVDITAGHGSFYRLGLGRYIRWCRVVISSVGRSIYRQMPTRSIGLPMSIYRHRDLLRAITRRLRFNSPTGLPRKPDGDLAAV